MLPAARVGDNHLCPMVTPGVPPIPHVGGPVMPPGAPLVMTGGPFQARVSDMATCVGPPDVIAMGAMTVLVQGLPAARMSDLTAHGGMIAIGLPTVLIGGPAFALPPNITVKGPPDFQQKTIRDLYLISTLPSGQVLINRLGAAGEPITIIPTSDANGYCSPNNGLFARLGIPTGSTIQYNPDLSMIVQGRPPGGGINEPPQVILAHEMAHALANSEGNHRHGTDPSPPASQPNIAEEEAQTIGTGSHTGRTPSENSIRDDLGLPQRDNHVGWTYPQPGFPGPPPSIRPGEPPL